MRRLKTQYADEPSANQKLQELSHDYGKIIKREYFV